MAPHAWRVTGIDASRRRAQVCRQNAGRLGLTNVDFVAVEPSGRLPFPDGVFDGVMAASSVEQTPSPKDTLAELLRVLRRGGRLRMHYEALGRYRGGQERDLWLWPVDERQCRLILYDRRVENEAVIQVGLTYALPAQELRRHFSGDGGRLTFADVTVERFHTSRSSLVDARVCRTTHPSGATWMTWLRQAGFRDVHATHSGAWIAGKLFDVLPSAHRPQTLDELDSYLRPIVSVTTRMPAPPTDDPMLTAIK